MTYSAGFTASPLGYDDSNNTCSWQEQVEELLMTGGEKILEERPGNICVVAAINTERLCLREARISDLDDLHAVWSNQDVMRYWYDNGFFLFFLNCTYLSIHVYMYLSIGIHYY